jgi:hypothetical protein
MSRNERRLLKEEVQRGIKKVPQEGRKEGE